MYYAIGLDYGTNSCRCVIVNVANGEEVGTTVCEYETGDHGIILDKRDHNVARQNPADYIKGIEVTIKKAMAAAKKADKKFKAELVIGIGVDTTGSTPLPVDKNGTPLAMLKEFKKNPSVTGLTKIIMISLPPQQQHGTKSCQNNLCQSVTLLGCMRINPNAYKR
jgi:L-ribulokinase